jgi:hypothetical protein
VTSSPSNPGPEAAGPPSVPEVFRRALPLLRSVFREYAIPDSTSHSAENDLTAWFVRFCRRNPEMGANAQILALLSLACSFSRGYARLQSGGAPTDPGLKSLLRRTPEEVAQRIAAGDGIRTGARAGESAWARLLAFARVVKR